MKKKVYDELNKTIDFTQLLFSYHTDDSLLHFEQVETYTRILITYYNRLYPDRAIGRDEFERILIGAKLHDIGKMSIPDEILMSKHKLNSEEYEKAKSHTVRGAEIVKKMSEIYDLGELGDVIESICRSHHERYDGSGYPDGLVGDQIPLGAQLVSIGEVYSALTDENYKKAMTHDEAINEIVSGKCGVFNPDLIECLKAAEKNLSDVLCVKDNAKRLKILQRLDITYRSHYWKIKRILDIIFSLGILTVFSPVYLILMLAIVIDDPKGGPFYKQVRLGRHRKPFYMYKFRTMIKDADKMQAKLMAQNEKDGPVFKMANDPRITRVGRFIRKTGLDELPQFINVLKGDMSIVGPRPPLPNEVAEYSRYHELRLSVTPGITCLWQIQPHRDAIDFETWMDMDIDYIASRSVFRDIGLMFATIPSIFCRRGS